MADQTKYRLNNHAGPFPPGTILTRAQIDAAGADFAFWESTKTISKAREDDEQVEGAEQLLDDAAMKAEIEERIRLGNVTARKDQDQIAADVRRNWDDLREKRHERVNEELAKNQDKGAKEKPGPVPKLPPKGANPNLPDGTRPTPAVNIGGNALSAYDGKTDAQILAMFHGGTEASNRAQLKQVRDAQRARDDKD